MLIQKDMLIEHSSEFVVAGLASDALQRTVGRPVRCSSYVASSFGKAWFIRMWSLLDSDPVGLVELRVDVVHRRELCHVAIAVYCAWNVRNSEKRHNLILPINIPENTPATAPGLGCL